MAKLKVKSQKKPFDYLPCWPETGERIRQVVENRKRIKGSEKTTIASYLDELSKMHE